MTTKKQRKLYRKIIIYAIIAVPIYFVGTSFLGYDLFEEPFLDDYYFTSNDQTFELFKMNVTPTPSYTSQIIKCTIKNYAQIYDVKGNKVYDYSRNVSFQPKVLDLLSDRMTEIDYFKFYQSLECDKGYNNYLKPYMKSYDLTTVASVYDKNKGWITVDTEKSRYNSLKDMSGNKHVLTEMQIKANKVEAILNPSFDSGSNLKFITSGKMTFKQYADDPNSWNFNVNNVGSYAGFVVKGKTEGANPLSNIVEIRFDNGKNGNIDLGKEKDLEYTVRLVKFDRNETTPILEIIFNPNGCKPDPNDRGSCDQTIKKTKMGVRISGDDASFYGHIGLDRNNDGKYDERDMGTYNVIVKGAKVNDEYMRYTSKQIMAKVSTVTPTPTSNGGSTIIPTGLGSSGDDLIRGEVRLKWEVPFEGGVMSGDFFKDEYGIAELTPMELYGSQADKTGKLTLLKLEPYIHLPEKPSLNKKSTKDVTYSGTVEINGKEKNISQNYLRTNEVIIREGIQNGKQAFAISPLQISHTKLNDIVLKLIQSEEMNDKEYSVKFRFNISAEFQLFDPAQCSSNVECLTYNGVLRDSVFNITFDYKPKVVNTEPRPDTPDPDENGNGNGGSGSNGGSIEDDFGEGCPECDVVDDEIPFEESNPKTNIEEEANKVGFSCKSNEEMILLKENNQEYYACIDGGDITTTSEEPEGNAGNTGISATITIEDLKKLLENVGILDTGLFSGIIPDNIPIELIIIFAILTPIILFIIAKRARKTYNY